MSRRHKKHAHVNHERWLVSYADFITLLFAFFVVLYASSQVDKKRAAAVSVAIQGAFQQLGVMSVVAGSNVPQPLATNTQSVAPAASAAKTQSAPTGGGGSGFDPEKLKKQLEEALGPEIRNHEVTMRVGPEGLVVSLKEVGFFNSGDDILLPNAVPVLQRIAKILNDKKFQVRVEGHTDNIPIHTGKFSSNWELSTSRATQVVTMLVEQYGFNASLLSVAGYSEYRPIADNSTEEGRKMNRRVDLVVVSAEAPQTHPPQAASQGQNPTVTQQAANPSGASVR
jgi:chemotaxis protein MotB